MFHPSFPNIFESRDNWERYRHLTLFTNKRQIQQYQSQFLTQLLAAPPCQEFDELKTAGTTTARKTYTYPKRYRQIIEDHHMWKLLRSHNIQSGNVVTIHQSPRGTNEIKGPFQNAAQYLENQVYDLSYNTQTDKAFWQRIIEEIKQLNPVFIYMLPSELQYIHSIAGSFQLDCPGIFSCETLYPSVRSLAESIFTKCIDKMQCWDGGLGFFECPYGRKHIYDELCIVEGQGELITTDLFNDATKFIDHRSGDCGDHKQGMCDCGLYGNYFTEFRGKYIECLVARDGSLIPGTMVNQLLCNTIASAYDSLLFNIVQVANKDLHIYVAPYDPKLCVLFNVMLSPYFFGNNTELFRCFGEGQLQSGNEQREYQMFVEPLDFEKSHEREKRLLIKTCALN